MQVEHVENQFSKTHFINLISKFQDTVQDLTRLKATPEEIVGFGL